MTIGSYREAESKNSILLHDFLYHFITDTIGRLLNSKHWLPLSKMSTCFILIHPIITRIVFLSGNSSLHMSMAVMVSELNHPFSTLPILLKSKLPILLKKIEFQPS